MNDRPGHNIGYSSDDEHWQVIARVRVQHLARIEGQQRAADGPRATADADDRTYRLAREHVRRQREQIGRPALMGPSRKSYQQRRSPSVWRVVSQNHYRDCEGEKTHGGFARPVDRPTALDQSPRDPATAHRTYIGNQINRRYIGDERRPFHAVILIEKFWQPEEVEPPDWIGQHFSEGEGP